MLAIVVLAMAILGCSSFGNLNPLGDTGFDIDSLDGGNLRVETSLPLDLIQTTLETASNFGQMTNLTLEPHNGYIYVNADEIEVEGITGTNVSYHLELSSQNGDLVAQITNVQSDNNALNSSHFESYNQQISEILTDENGLEDITNFESVSITPDGVTVVVIIEAGGLN
jgi:hypothetical protein